jgi:hypothetical protein
MIGATDELIGWIAPGGSVPVRPSVPEAEEWPLALMAWMVPDACKWGRAPTLT